MFSNEEKVLILGSLFHDIGKFEQRCTNNPNKMTHDQLGAILINSGRFKDRFAKIIGMENITVLINIIGEHHSKNVLPIVNYTKLADHLSASERVEAEKNDENKINWKHKHLASLFSKTNLFETSVGKPRYYKHSPLTAKDHNIIIPQELTEEEIKLKEYAYSSFHYDKFLNELEAVLDFYETDSDFDSLINLLLMLLEKWMWCVPDFTGSSETDISLFNHLKDVAAISHALYLTDKDNPGSKRLSLIIGDIPGIQNYIFDVVNKKPAKILRGRSIFVQILTRNLASLILRECGLSECNLIMLAGGKFYILAPDSEKFKKSFSAALFKIDEYLFNNFRMELSFNSCLFPFDYSELKTKKITFGQIIEKASIKLLENKHLLYKDKLFSVNDTLYKSYVWPEDYINDDGSGTDSIKCAVTAKPIRKKYIGEIEDISYDGKETEILQVDKQVENEYEIGNKITKNNLLIPLEENGLNISTKKIKRINSSIKSNDIPEGFKLILNPYFDELLEQVKSKKIGRELFSNTQFIEVANYCSMDSQNNSVLSFEEIIKKQENGAKYLTLIKGDIDNLGLIMAYGLKDDKEDLTSISRTTTLSNHLKYYFSFFMNGFLEKWEADNNSKVYTVFAGGDDLMLITPQTSALNLIGSFNREFSKFACDNPEVHISYSVTHFKDHSPIKIISEIAEQNQNTGKKENKKEQLKMVYGNNPKSFNYTFDKSSTRIFDTSIKNHELDKFIEYVNKLTKWAEKDLSHGLLRKLLTLSKMQKKYDETKDASYLMGYARLTHSINRTSISNKDLINFLDNTLLVNTDNNHVAKDIKKFLYPLICQVIYNTRK